MAKKSKSSGSTRVLNPAFDPRILTIGSTTTKSRKLTRGFLQSDSSITDYPGIPGRVNFLFNPQSVSVSHAMATNAVETPPGNRVPGVPSVVYDTLNPVGEVTFSLLFDRTYELWDKTKVGTTVGQYGCYADVLGIYMLLGITGGIDWEPVQGPFTPGMRRPENGFTTLFPSSPLLGAPIYCYMGVMKYYGFVDSLGITVTHWTENMVPLRCEADISMSLLDDPTNTRLFTGDSRQGSVIPQPSTGSSSSPSASSYGVDPATGGPLVPAL